MKFRFVCCMCNESFTVSTDNFVNKEHLACPNCAKTTHSDHFQRLKDIARLINELTDEKVVRNGMTVRNHPDFYFTVQ